MSDSLLQLPPLSLYVHLPWCVRKCPYCDFNSHVRPEELPEQAYVDALLADLEQDLPRVWGRPVVSVFLGGGTPSLFSGAAIERLLDGVWARLSVRPGAEITLETNPGTVEYGRFEDYRAAGVTRLSIGAQSFHDPSLQALGRIHSAKETHVAIASARAAGFDEINIDLMHGLPQQDLSLALADVEAALDLGVPHISHYQLTLEPNTLFAARPPQLPDADLCADIEEACSERLAAAGLQRYEVSAWARPGHEAQHNLNYWRFGDYLGIGAGAHGKITDLARPGIFRYHRLRHPRLYLASTPAQRISGEEWVAAERLPFEFMLNALRLVEGFDLSLFEQRSGLNREVLLSRMHALCRDGLLQLDDQRLAATPRGLQLLNDVQLAFLPSDELSS